MEFPSLIEFAKHENMFMVTGPLALCASVGLWIQFIRLSHQNKHSSNGRNTVRVLAIVFLFLAVIHLVGTYGPFIDAIRWRRIHPETIASIRIERLAWPGASPQQTIIIEDPRLILQGFQQLSHAQNSPFYRSWEDGYRMQLRFTDETQYSDFYLLAYRMGLHGKTREEAFGVIPQIGHGQDEMIDNAGEYVCPEFHAWLRSAIEPFFAQPPMTQE